MKGDKRFGDMSGKQHANQRYRRRLQEKIAGDNKLDETWGAAMLKIVIHTSMNSNVWITRLLQTLGSIFHCDNAKYRFDTCLPCDSSRRCPVRAFWRCTSPSPAGTRTPDTNARGHDSLERALHVIMLGCFTCVQIIVHASGQRPGVTGVYS